MTITYGRFAKKTGVTPADRSYTQAILAEFHSWLHPKGGVVYSEGSDLLVTALGSPTMAVNVAAGVAIASGWYWLKSTATEELAIANADATNPRKDLVVARFRLTEDDYRDAILAVKTGTPAASPVAPTCTIDTDTYELALAVVDVAANATQILTANITTAASQPLCGWFGQGKMHFEDDGSLDAASLQIHNVADPDEDGDAANQGWVNDQIAALDTLPAHPSGSANKFVAVKSDESGYELVAGTKFYSAAASDTSQVTNNTSVTRTGDASVTATYQKSLALKQNWLPGGTYRIKYTASMDNASAQGSCQCRVGGYVFASQSLSTSPTEYTFDVTIPGGGGTQIDLYLAAVTGYHCTCTNWSVCATLTEGTP